MIVTREVEGMSEQNEIFKRQYPNVFVRCHAIAKDLRKKTDIEYKEYFNNVIAHDRVKFREIFGSIGR